MTHDDYETPMSENDVGMMKVQTPASYLPEIVNVVNAVEGLLPPDVAKKLDDIKTKALALIDSLRENVALNHKKIEFAENHLKQFCHWIHKAHDGKP